jgi:hypothetical protein
MAEYDSFRIWAICWMMTSPVGMTIGIVNPPAAFDSPMSDFARSGSYSYGAMSSRQNLILGIM